MHDQGPRSRARALLSALLLAAGLLVGGAAHAGFVVYFHTFGEWTVVCSADQLTARRTCTLGAPAPELRAGGPRSAFSVTEAGDGAFTVSVLVPGVLTPGTPVFVRVDAREPRQAQPNRYGEFAWNGTEAAAVIAELKAGDTLVLRAFLGAGATARDESVSLIGFTQAFDTYRAKLREHGALR